MIRMTFAIPHSTAMISIARVPNIPPRNDQTSVKATLPPDFLLILFEFRSSQWRISTRAFKTSLAIRTISEP